MAGEGSRVKVVLWPSTLSTVRAPPIASASRSATSAVAAAAR
jgi:hypothetical protein